MSEKVNRHAIELARRLELSIFHEDSIKSVVSDLSAIRKAKKLLIIHFSVMDGLK